MRHINYVLKPATIDNTKPKDKRCDLTDGGSAVLKVLPSGSKTWRFKYHPNGKREKVTIGAYPAFTIKLSMPTGTDTRVVRQATSEFAKVELANHRYMMVLHTHRANPHVHISTRAEGRDGKRLNPRKEDLQRWRQTFAEKLRDRVIEAEASSQATRGVTRRSLRFGPRVQARCSPEPRSPRRWRHRLTRPTASSARASSTS